MLMPLTFGMDPVGAFIMFGGIYYGAMYGGSTTSILVKMPGEASSVMTALDGFRMTCKGRGGAALATAAIGSFIAGTFAKLMLMLMAPAPALVEFALAFGPWEYFALMVLALTAITGLSSESPAKGAFATLLGLALGTIGIDLQTGQARFTFGAQDCSTKRRRPDSLPNCARTSSLPGKEERTWRSMTHPPRTPVRKPARAPANGSPMLVLTGALICSR